MHAAGEDLRICRFQTGHGPAPGLRRPDRRRAGRVRLSALAGQPGRPGARRLARRRRDADRLAAPAAHRRRSSATRWTTSATCSTWPTGSPAELARAGPDRLGRGRVRRLPRRRSRTGPRRTAGGGSRACTSSTAAGLEVARRLSEWRLEDARRANRPLRQVLRDDLLVAIAKRQPASRRDLEALRDFNRPAPAEPGRRDPRRDRRRPRPCPPTSSPSPPSGTTTGRACRWSSACWPRPSPSAAPSAGSPPASSAASSDLKDLIRWHAEGRPEDRRPALAPGLARRGLRRRPSSTSSPAAAPSASSTRGRRPRRPRPDRAGEAPPPAPSRGMSADPLPRRAGADGGPVKGALLDAAISCIVLTGICAATPGRRSVVIGFALAFLDARHAPARDRLPLRAPARRALRPDPRRARLRGADDPLGRHPRPRGHDRDDQGGGLRLPPDRPDVGLCLRDDRHGLPGLVPVPD